ncbi:RUS family member 1-like [Symsagittifera roscoffensis]|uniref:RUS family member 1-like n=1 Tax=Symsagittifera roscoffensis TaxID=84072 RepID=UPI00307B676D
MVGYESRSSNGCIRTSLEQCEPQKDSNRCFRVRETRNRTSTDLNCLKAKQVLSDLFLPQNYPSCVSQDYLEYQVWDSAQALFSSVCGTLAARATFEGLGVGEQSATVSGATYTWMLKMSSGMIGSIVFAYYQSSSLDAHCKQWRLFADILNDLAMTMAIISPLFSPFTFVMLSCLSSLFHALVGVAGSTTRAALRVHQARDNNMADVCAKDNSQEQLVNLVGLLLGFLVTSMVDFFGQVFVWSLFVMCTCCHLVCNYYAVKCVTMESLNPSRFQTLVNRFWADYRLSSDPTNLTMKSINQSENLFFWKLRRLPRVSIGVPINELHQPIVVSSTASAMFSLGNLTRLDCSQLHISIALSEACSSSDIVRACFVAYSCDMDSTRLKEHFTLYGEEGLTKYMDELESTFPAFQRTLNSCGWKCDDHSLLEVDAWRFSPIR